MRNSLIFLFSAFLFSLSQLHSFQTQSLICYFLSTLFRFLDSHFNLATMNCHQKGHHWMPELLISCKLLFYYLVKHCLAGTIYFCARKRSRICTNRLIGGFFQHVVYITMASLPKGQYYVLFVKISCSVNDLKVDYVNASEWF